jgi:hypothetical protein
MTANNLLEYARAVAQIVRRNPNQYMKAKRDLRLRIIFGLTEDQKHLYLEMLDEAIEEFRLEGKDYTATVPIPLCVFDRVSSNLADIIWEK